jgi:RNA polymerase sigma-70 factor (ECF subfamily)
MTLPAAEFESLALAQSDLLYRLARRLTHNGTQAEDLVQETFLRALKARDSFKLEKYGIRPWLVRIMHNLHFSRSDREKRQPRATDETALDATPGRDGSPIGVPIDMSSFDAMDERVVHALENLPEEYKEVLLLWAVEDFSYKEISEALDIPMGTVMSRLHRARQRLSEQLKDFAKEARITQE